ncbi:MAG TPA: SUMF1/EgtB/PvdO family nonheme iron enzyme [Pyrinomonadaceae bacterium]|jgi:formylglycine-generating enzyme required for sulfatase activity|nr:SUMF1/EgtB/PvdO family nonheme iron enzyme [Pyrinomonadaceae bacterium]
MSNARRLNAAPNGKPGESRLLPLAVACVVCFAAAGLLGGGSWYLFGSRERGSHEPSSTPVVQSTPAQSATPAAAVATPETQPTKTAPAGELPVAGGEVVLGGGDTGVPLRREFVEPFLVAETEVTNEQYRDFLKATDHKPPEHWKGGEFPPGSALEPVAGVSWNDAVAYCKWLSREINAEVRLPTEAEWQAAARGREERKYPWGNDWDERAADSAEAGGRVRAVKSFPAGKSPSGAYDMAGNVWEWVADEWRGEDGEPKVKDGVTFYVIKGGSAKEPRSLVNVESRYGVAADKSSAALGFRYVVRRQGG